MAAPVTEVVDFTLSPSADPTTAFSAACATLTQQPGCRAARYSLHHEDASKLTLFVDWDSISAHEALRANADLYGPFAASLAPFVAAPPVMSHVAFDPPAKGGVLDVAPAVEVLNLHFPADYGLEREQAAVKTLGEFGAITQKAAGPGDMDLLVGTPALGWAAHMKYRDTDAFRESIGMIRGLEGLKGISMNHVACQKA
ncbi:hypothetical protein PG994_004966 [Apiospora phragmitis]|uniref:ABM domain-containing protein n=1 Tax=Apiospora phragmitis TaxID=2905665 RepID=A0ABR1VSB5_9PEZI